MFGKPVILSQQIPHSTSPPPAARNNNFRPQTIATIFHVELSFLSFGPPKILRLILCKYPHAVIQLCLDRQASKLNHALLFCWPPTSTQTKHPLINYGWSKLAIQGRSVICCSACGEVVIIFFIRTILSKIEKHILVSRDFKLATVGH